MCDQRTEMLGGDCGPDGEEPALPSPTGGLGDEGRVSSGQQNGHAQSESLRREERRASDEEAGREDEELNVGSYELSRPGCVSASTESSENTDGSRGQVHREVMVTVAEMKKRIPSDKSSRSKASTVEALHYALRCVKQVQANSDYYRLLTQNCHDERRDATVCTLEELESVTCEHTLKNTNSFVVVFSLTSGRVLNASEQAPSILCCKRTFLESAKFVELLFHQDVDVFYSHTAQPHLPPWSNSHTLGGLFDCAQVKSFFCRIRGGKDREGEMCYKPFRITPFLLTLQGTGRRGEDEEPCCLALAECILSGYEEPRIPMDKRIFTTTHSPGCVLLEVEERAVPLLGYLPQDLIGKSLLSFIHPDDRLLMLSVHRKVFKCAGQNPIEHSPVRLRCHNRDHITLETSWSSFINPWSRKVAFIIGRHKVRTIPLNKDVFAAPTKENVTGANEEIKDLQAKIYKLFLQPIHNNGSSGYGSLGSNGSHEHYISVASSSDGNLWEDSHREPQICANVDRVKSLDQRANLVSKHTTILGKTATARLPRAVLNPRILDHEDGSKQTHVASYQQINCVDNIIRYLDSYTGPALKRKSHSHSLASSSSSSSTSEDDMPAAATDPAHGSLDETKPLKDTPMGNEPADAALPSVRRDLNPNTEDQMFVDLTKEVLSAHTEKEEQEYVDVFRHRVLRSPYNSFLQLNNSSVAHSHHSGENPRPVSAGRLKRCRRGKPRHKCPKPQGSTDSYTSPAGPPRLVPDTYRPSSESSEPQMATPYSQTSPLNASFFPMMANQPGLEQLPRLQQLCGATPVVLQCPDRPQVSYSFNIMQSTQSQQGMQTFQIEPFHNLHPIVPTQGINPYMTPVMTVILPGNPTCTPGNQSIYSQGSPSMLPQAPITMAGFAPSSVPFSEPQFQAQPGLITQACTGPLLCSPSSVGEEEEAPEPQALFSSSRSSSPLQLNLLQEELPKLREGPRSTGDNLELHSIQSENPSESGDHDAQCTSQKLLDMLLQEDARSRTGSNASGSGQSGGSLGSGSGSKGTSHTGDSSKYFASNDSSDASCEARKSQEARTQHRHVLHTRDSLWEIIQNTPERVMMTYQIHTRDQNEVLAEDREKLRVLQPLQPWFSQEQREELAEVHPWIKQHTVPKETQGCGSCNSGSSVVYSPHPTALYNLSPREIPQQDYVGPVVDT